MIVSMNFLMTNAHQLVVPARGGRSDFGRLSSPIRSGDQR
jgi:hypothetical protein